MPEKHPDRYPSLSTSTNCDYEAEDSYSITITTKDSLPYFGKITNDAMVLNLIGLIALNFWNLIPTQFPSISINAPDLTPDSIYGILLFKENQFHSSHLPLILSNFDFDVSPCIELNAFTGIKNTIHDENIARAIRWFKGACTYEIRKTIPAFEWQR
jgi:hypothetical protein